MEKNVTTPFNESVNKMNLYKNELRRCISKEDVFTIYAAYPVQQIMAYIIFFLTFSCIWLPWGLNSAPKLYLCSANLIWTEVPLKNHLVPGSEKRMCSISIWLSSPWDSGSVQYQLGGGVWAFGPSAWWLHCTCHLFHNFERERIQGGGEGAEEEPVLSAQHRTI